MTNLDLEAIKASADERRVFEHVAGPMFPSQEVTPDPLVCDVLDLVEEVERLRGRAMTDLDLEAIKARAQAATPGPWTCDSGGINNDTPDKVGEYEQILEPYSDDPSEDAYVNISDEDAAHIAGMDPTTTLALIDEVERLRYHLAITDDMIERAAEAICDVPPLSPVWPGLADEKKKAYRTQARATLEAALEGNK